MYQKKFNKKSEKPEKLLLKAACTSGAKSTEKIINDHFCIICLLNLLLFLCVYVLSKWANKCETEYKSKCN